MRSMWTVMANLIRPCYADGLRFIKIFIVPCCDTVLLLEITLHIIMYNSCDMGNDKAVCEGWYHVLKSCSLLDFSNYITLAFHGNSLSFSDTSSPFSFLSEFHSLSAGNHLILTSLVD